jgi:DNA polymerase-3 subunit alpha
MGLAVKPPSVNLSEAAFSVRKSDVIFGLAAIKSFGQTSAQQIAGERERGGEFTSLQDFCRRLVPVNLAKAGVKTLIQAGALDELGERNALLAALDTCYGSAQKQQVDAARGQNALFDDFAELAADGEGEALPKVPPLSEEERLQLEKELLGLYISDHPLLRAQEKLARCCTAQVEDLPQYADKASLLVGGVVADPRTHVTRKGETMMFFTLQGLTASVEVTVFPRTYQKCGELIKKDELLVVDGTLERDARRSDNGNGNGVKLLCNRLTPLARARAASQKRFEDAVSALAPPPALPEDQPEPEPRPRGPWVCFELHLEDMERDTLANLASVLRENPGKHRVALLFIGSAGERRTVGLGEEVRVHCGAALVGAARQLPGVTYVYEEEYLPVAG